MISLQEVLKGQPYPWFKLAAVPENLQQQLKQSMLCIYNIDTRSYEFATVGRFGADDILFVPHS